MDSISSRIATARQQSLGELLRRTAAREPHKTAIICGEVRWTYAQFDAICNRLGRGLIAQGVAKGDRVAVLSRNSHGFAALRYAAAKIGAVLVPINFMLNADEIRFILANSGAKLMCVGPDLVEMARKASASGCGVEKLVWLPGEEPGTDLPATYSHQCSHADAHEPLSVRQSDGLVQLTNTPHRAEVGGVQIRLQDEASVREKNSDGCS